MAGKRGAWDARRFRPALLPPGGSEEENLEPALAGGPQSPAVPSANDQSPSVLAEDGLVHPDHAVWPMAQGLGLLRRGGAAAQHDSAGADRENERAARFEGWPLPEAGKTNKNKYYQNFPKMLFKRDCFGYFKA